MKPYVKMYLDYHGLTEGDFIPCKVCGNEAVDVHHIEPKGMGGRSDMDRTDNLIALCRKCHEDAHRSKLEPEYLKRLIYA